jgi:uncharacterized protein
MDDTPRYVVFVGSRLVAEGAVAEILPVLKRRFDRAPSDAALVFDVSTGRQVDFDLSGTLEDALARTRTGERRGPGRPKLGVTSREVALLPRHWAWLEEQPNGISAAIRRLVEEASKKEPGRERARRIRASLSNQLTALAGDRPHYEEVTRALFSGDVARVEDLVARWPRDLRDYTMRQVRAAHEAESSDRGEATS